MGYVRVIYQFPDNLWWNECSNQVYYAQDPMKPERLIGTPSIMQAKLLKILCEYHPSPCPNDQIIKALWPHGFISSESLTQAIKRTRDFLNDEHKTLIENVKLQGYRINIIQVIVSENIVDEADCSQKKSVKERIKIEWGKINVVPYLVFSALYVALLPVIWWSYGQWYQHELAGITHDLRDLARLPGITIQKLSEQKLMFAIDQHQCSVNYEQKTLECTKN
ncbi:TPA: toxin-coregulated pilus transcriptional regulator TcpP [Vibrio cholerae]|uniref:Toxin co-regulated pilus biosynthesis protein P n=2 Tax=Vibrio cholerae TaxID=666 RepID=Q93TT6_VIBCL|nr:toxin-coregulated pilus transcriptional regulator TcpP [Vibrio cholerae]AAK20753.1 toxin-coregulated pilus biosynthesis protein P [Vibrio cholerae]ABQ20005.1 toxin co-regulated pilus biosynthesis protein P [Vibrio cholerae O395]ACK75629.1 toxin co-regulated pilus biosynthesis protein P [Vibrio cholerae]ACP08857.1 toxin co-regulated pilus biosynthesis protein P [Vibrio cholerae O395]EEY41569.1 toxin co-regulated pilus biosynthesis protein P transcriptional activator of ToxT promoter [Vibrio 